MKPTMKLRFIEREITIHHADCLYASIKTVRVLQQWWQSPDILEALGIGGVAPISEDGEWRDVPLEIES